MKILLLADQVAPTGGAEIMTSVLRAALRRRGHDARIMASRVGAEAAARVADYTCYGTTSRLRTALQTANPWAFSAVRRVLREFRPDVVHVRIFLTQLSPLILPALRGWPVLYHAVWPRAICPTGTKVLPGGEPCMRPAGLTCYRSGCVPLRDGLPHVVQRLLWNRWRNVFGLVVANSDFCRRALKEGGVESDAVVWNGVPLVPACPPLSDPPVVAFAGRLIPQKGVDVLVRAFARVVADRPDARLLVAGEGPDRENLVRLTQNLGLVSQVSFLGLLPRNELERQFAGVWVQVVPSRWTESFGLTAAEAMMRGTAVVASRLGGLSEYIVDGHNGRLVPVGDDVTLSATLLDLLNNRSTTEAMGARARAFALAELTDDRCAAQFETLYARLLTRTLS